MTMTHKEAMRSARNVARESRLSMPQFADMEDLYDAKDTIFIRAYIEALGLALVPKFPTTAMLDLAFLSDCVTDGEVYQTMISAAPDPFKDGAA